MGLEAAAVLTSRRVDTQASFPASRKQLSRWAVGEGPALGQEAPGSGWAAGPERQAWHRSLCGGWDSRLPRPGCGGVSSGSPVRRTLAPLWGLGQEILACNHSLVCLTRSPQAGCWDRLSTVSLGGVVRRGIQIAKSLKDSLILELSAGGNITQYI